MRANVIGEVISAGPHGARQRQRFLGVGDPRRAAAEHRAELAVVESGHPRRADREQERGRLATVGVVGGVEHLLGRDEAEEVEDVERAPDRGVEEDAWPAGEVAGERGEVGDPGVRDDQLRLVGVHQARERVRDRRQAAAAVDQDRHLALGGQLEDGREPVVVEQELLGPRVELDPAGAEVEAARRLLDRALREVEPDERDEARRRSAPRSRASGRSGRESPDGGRARPGRT